VFSSKKCFVASIEIFIFVVVVVVVVVVVAATFSFCISRGDTKLELPVAR
jgi:flagellar basal body-associated protein FliL